MRKAVHDGTAVPVVFTSARNEVGVRDLLDLLVKYGPSPAEMEIHQARKADGASVPVKADPAAAFVGQVFKVAYPQRGRLAFVKVLAGKLKGDTLFNINDDRHPVKAGHLFRVQGGETAEVHEVVAGDIVAIGRMENLHINDLLHHNGDLAKSVPPHYPVPDVQPGGGGQDPRGHGQGQHRPARLAEEDKTFAVTLDHQTGERVINGLGELHLRHGAAPAAPQARAGGQHQAAERSPTARPSPRPCGTWSTHTRSRAAAPASTARSSSTSSPRRGAGYVFEDAIFGGSISQSFRPSVDKGVQGKLHDGVLAGYPMVDVKVRLIDGKEHAVDSKDIAFQVAGREAFKKAFMAAKPVLLEPIVHVDVSVPADQQGIVNGLLAARRADLRRGHALGDDGVGEGADAAVGSRGVRQPAPVHHGRPRRLLGRAEPLRPGAGAGAAAVDRRLQAEGRGRINRPAQPDANPPRRASPPSLEPATASESRHEFLNIYRHRRGDDGGALQRRDHMIRIIKGQPAHRPRRQSPPGNSA